MIGLTEGRRASRTTGMECIGGMLKEWPLATTVDVRALVRIVILSAILGALLSSLYLCKCMLGIDVIDGPSPLHNALYWIVEGYAGQWRGYLGT